MRLTPLRVAALVTLGFLLAAPSQAAAGAVDYSPSCFVNTLARNDGQFVRAGIDRLFD